MSHVDVPTENEVGIPVEREKKNHNSNLICHTWHEYLEEGEWNYIMVWTKTSIVFLLNPSQNMAN